MKKIVLAAAFVSVSSLSALAQTAPGTKELLRNCRSLPLPQSVAPHFCRRDVTDLRHGRGFRIDPKLTYALICFAFMGLGRHPTALCPLMLLTPGRDS